jgi:hypothetical protein
MYMGRILQFTTGLNLAMSQYPADQIWRRRSTKTAELQNCIISQIMDEPHDEKRVLASQRMKSYIVPSSVRAP